MLRKEAASAVRSPEEASGSRSRAAALASRSSEVAAFRSLGEEERSDSGCPDAAAIRMDFYLNPYLKGDILNLIIMFS